MIEGIIIFAIGYVFGKYTDKIIDIVQKLYLKYFKKDNENG